jgi:hypothetical protein
MEGARPQERRGAGRLGGVETLCSLSTERIYAPSNIGGVERNVCAVDSDATHIAREGRVSFVEARSSPLMRRGASLFRATRCSDRFPVPGRVSRPSSAG